MQDFHLLTSVVLMMTCLFLLGECFDADDDNGRICGSITPDTVLYTLFRSKLIKKNVTCPSQSTLINRKENPAEHA
jgi:hypothetical protein